MSNPVLRVADLLRRRPPPPDASPRCGLCGKAWPRPTVRAWIPTPEGPVSALVCRDHLDDPFPPTPTTRKDA